MLKAAIGVLILMFTLFVVPQVALAESTMVTIPERNGQIDFTAPSQNIECIYTPAGGTPHYTAPGGQAEISCDRLEPSYLRVTLLEKGPVQIFKHVSDPSCCAIDNFLKYGESVALGPFVCNSQPTGMTCRRGKIGFRISKSGLKTLK